MKIYKLDTASDFEKLNLCLAIGNFDGIHKGHQEIINKIKEIASNNNLSLIHISEPTRLGMISYAVFCLKKKKKQRNTSSKI